MKVKQFLGIFMLCLISCKRDSNHTIIKNNYPYYKIFDDEAYLEYNDKTGLLIERFHHSGKSNSSKIHFLNLKKDTVIINTKNFKGLPSFTKDFCLYKDNFIQLNTHPRTMGENHKSTDIITVYDSSYNVVKKKDMDISKYPNGNALLAGDSNALFYITDGWKFKERPSMVISKIDDSLNILKQRIIKSSKDTVGYNPLKSVFIPNIGVVIVSSSSYFEVDDEVYYLELFDMDFNKLWSKKISDDDIIALNYIESEHKIMMTTKNYVQFWNIQGNKIDNYELNGDIISSTIGNSNVFLLVKAAENTIVYKTSFLGKLLEEKKVSIKDDKKNNVYLKYNDNNLFLLSIDNNKRLTIDKISFK